MKAAEGLQDADNILYLEEDFYETFHVGLAFRAFEHSDILECNPQSNSKIGRSFGLHSRVIHPIRSAIHFSIQKKA